MNKFKKFFKFFRFCFKTSPFYVILIIFNAIFSSTQIFANVIIPRFLINELLDKQDINMLILWGSLIVGINLLFNFYNKLYERIYRVLSDKTRRKMHQAMADKIMYVPYSFLEDPYYLDLKERAVFACNNQSALYRAVDNISQFIKYVITLIGLVAIMITLSVWLIVFLLVGIFLTYLLNFSYKKYETKFMMELIPINRKYGYYYSFVNKTEVQKDIRLYEINPLLTKTVKKYNGEIIKEFKKMHKRIGINHGLISIINSFQSALIYGYIGIRTISKIFGPKILIGDFTMYVSSAISFSTSFSSMMEKYTDLMQVLAYLDPFMEFMDLKEERHKKGIVFNEEIQTIEFRNVSFKYPKSDNLVLNDISFKINKGEKISIVGLNGAGKTTLIKLICRLYKPTQGMILINGIDIQSYDYKTYIDKISAVFQDYRLFNYSIKDNIISTEDYKEEELKQIIDKVGLTDKIKELKYGVNTNLNKSYDEEGVELSGGQMQKIAIARALYKNSSLVILDEPTSALDPLAEAEIYEHFNEMVQEKTAIYISHRMSSSVFCDKILVLNNGIIEHYDSHSNLMKIKDSLYYQMFTSQSKNYQLD